jgi:hypothetical protein
MHPVATTDDNRRLSRSVEQCGGICHTGIVPPPHRPGVGWVQADAQAVLVGGGRLARREVTHGARAAVTRARGHITVRDVVHRVGDAVSVNAHPQEGDEKDEDEREHGSFGHGEKAMHDTV